MSRINLNIVATGDFSQVNRQLDQLRATVAQINARGAGIGISSRDLESVNRAVASYDSLLHSTGAFSRQMVNVQDQTARFGRELESGKLKLSQYFGIWSKGSNESSRSLRELARQQLALENSVVRTDTSKIGKAYVDVPRLMQDAGRGTALARKQQELYNLALYKGGDALINWGKNTQWAGRQLMVGLTIPTVMFGQKAAQAFKEFDQQMTRMIKVYGDGINTTTSAQLEAIRGQVTSLAQDLAGRWGVAMKDTAAMASDLAATGLTGVKLLKATEEATRLATLGEIDRQDAMKATVALQTTFGLSSKELAKSVDFLNATENATSTSLQDLVEAIPRAGTVVKQLGGDYRELTVMMVSMREAGVASGESANAIKSALGALINPTAKTREQFQKFGIDLKNVRDAAGGDPVKMFASLGNELNKLDKISKARLIETLFGKYQFARVSALIDNLGRKGSQTQKVFELMGASAGQLAQNAQSELDRMAQSPSGKFQRALEGFQAKLLPVGEKFLNVATQILEAFGKVFDFLEKHPALQNFVTNIAGLVALVGPVIMLTGVFGNFLGYLVKAFATMKNFGNGFKGFGDIVTAESVAAARAGDLFQASLIDQSEAATILTDALSRLNAELAAYRGNAGGAGPGPINPPNGGGGRPPTRPPGPVILGPNGQPVPPPQPSPLIIPGAPPQTSPALIIPGAPNVAPSEIIMPPRVSVSPEVSSTLGGNRPITITMDETQIANWKPEAVGTGGRTGTEIAHSTARSELAMRIHEQHLQGSSPIGIALDAAGKGQGPLKEAFAEKQKRARDKRVKDYGGSTNFTPEDYAAARKNMIDEIITRGAWSAKGQPPNGAGAIIQRALGDTPQNFSLPSPELASSLGINLTPELQEQLVSAQLRSWGEEAGKGATKIVDEILAGKGKARLSRPEITGWLGSESRTVQAGRAFTDSTMAEAERLLTTHEGQIDHNLASLYNEAVVAAGSGDWESTKEATTRLQDHMRGQHGVVLQTLEQRTAAIENEYEKAFKAEFNNSNNAGLEMEERIRRSAVAAQTSVDAILDDEGIRTAQRFAENETALKKVRSQLGISRLYSRQGMGEVVTAAATRSVALADQVVQAERNVGSAVTESVNESNVAMERAAQAENDAAQTVKSGTTGPIPPPLIVPGQRPYIPPTAAELERQYGSLPPAPPRPPAEIILPRPGQRRAMGGMVNYLAGGDMPTWFGPGGGVSGPGGPRDDLIPAYLSNGEFVIKADSVSNVGVDALRHINETGTLPGYAMGGIARYQDGGIASLMNRVSEGKLKGKMEKNDVDKILRHAEKRMKDLKIDDSLIEKILSELADDIKKKGFRYGNLRNIYGEQSGHLVGTSAGMHKIENEGEAARFSANSSENQVMAKLSGSKIGSSATGKPTLYEIVSQSNKLNADQMDALDAVLHRNGQAITPRESEAQGAAARVLLESGKVRSPSIRLQLIELMTESEMLKSKTLSEFYDLKIQQLRKSNPRITDDLARLIRADFEDMHTATGSARALAERRIQGLAQYGLSHYESAYSVKQRVRDQMERDARAIREEEFKAKLAESAKQEQARMIEAAKIQRGWFGRRRPNFRIALANGGHVNFAIGGMSPRGYFDGGDAGFDGIPVSTKMLSDGTSIEVHSNGVVARRGGEVLGYMSLSDFNDEHDGREISKSYVSPEHRGSRNGTWLYGEIYKAAVEAGLKPVHSAILSNAGWRSANNLTTRLGDFHPDAHRYLDSPWSLVNGLPQGGRRTGEALPMPMDIAQEAVMSGMAGHETPGMTWISQHRMEKILASARLRRPTVAPPPVGVVMASGGPIYGAGTATSDSIPARLSNGEYVISAKGHKAAGTKFLDAINNGQFNMGGYAYAKGGNVKYKDGVRAFDSGGISGDEPTRKLGLIERAAARVQNVVSNGPIYEEENRIRQQMIDARQQELKDIHEKHDEFEREIRQRGNPITRNEELKKIEDSRLKAIADHTNLIEREVDEQKKSIKEQARRNLGFKASSGQGAGGMGGRGMGIGMGLSIAGGAAMMSENKTVSSLGNVATMAGMAAMINPYAGLAVGAAGLVKAFYDYQQSIIEARNKLISEYSKAFSSLTTTEQSYMGVELKTLSQINLDSLNEKTDAAKDALQQFTEAILNAAAGTVEASRRSVIEQAATPEQLLSDPRFQSFLMDTANAAYIKGGNAEDIKASIKSVISPYLAASGKEPWISKIFDYIDKSSLNAPAKSVLESDLKFKSDLPKFLSSINPNYGYNPTTGQVDKSNEGLYRTQQLNAFRGLNAPAEYLKQRLNGVDLSIGTQGHVGNIAGLFNDSSALDELRNLANREGTTQELNIAGRVLSNKNENDVQFAKTLLEQLSQALTGNKESWDQIPVLTNNFHKLFGTLTDPETANQFENFMQMTENLSSTIKEMFGTLSEGDFSTFMDQLVLDSSSMEDSSVAIEHTRQSLIQFREEMNSLSGPAADSWKANFDAVVGGAGTRGAAALRATADLETLQTAARAAKVGIVELGYEIGKMSNARINVIIDRVIRTRELRAFQQKELAPLLSNLEQGVAAAHENATTENADTGGGGSSGGGGGGGPSFDSTPYDKAIKAQQAIIDGINKEREARQKLADAQKANEDYMKSEWALRKKIAEAQGTGDFLGADLAQRELNALQDQKIKDDAERARRDAEDKRIADAEKEIKRLQEALDAAQKANQGGGGSSGGGGGGGGAAAPTTANLGADVTAEQITAFGQAGVAQAVVQNNAKTLEEALKNPLAKKAYKDAVIAIGKDAADELFGNFLNQSRENMFNGIPEFGTAFEQFSKDLEQDSTFQHFPADIKETINNQLKDIVIDPKLTVPEKTKAIDALLKKYKLDDTAIAAIKESWSVLGPILQGTINGIDVNGIGKTLWDKVKNTFPGKPEWESLTPDQQKYFSEVLTNVVSGADIPPDEIDKLATKMLPFYGGMTANTSAGAGGGQIPKEAFSAQTNFTKMLTDMIGPATAEAEKTSEASPIDMSSSIKTIKVPRGSVVFDAKGNATFESSGGEPAIVPLPEVTNAAYGGYISGPGGPRDDLIPARLSDGEYVVQANAVDYYGKDFLDKVNQRRYGGEAFAEGGRVGWKSGMVSPSIFRYAPSPYNPNATNTSNSNADSPGEPGGGGSGGSTSRGISTGVGLMQAAAAKYTGKGIPYSKDYNDMTHGFGCSGFVEEVLGMVGLSAGGAYSPTQMNHTPAISGNPWPGDLLFWQFPTNQPWLKRAPGEPNHVGFYYGGGMMLHSSGGTGPNLTSLSGNYDMQNGGRFLGAHRALPDSMMKVALERLQTVGREEPTDKSARYTIGKFHNGGPINYSKGKEVNAMVQGGEVVVPTAMVDRVNPLLDALTSGKMGLGEVTNHITINGSNHSPKVIAEMVVGEIEKSMKRTVNVTRVR